MFSIKNPVDEETGKVVEPQVAFEPGAISHPLPYRAEVKPRSGRHEEVIREVERMFPWEESDAGVLEGMVW